MIVLLQSVVLLGVLLGVLGLGPAMIVAKSRVWALALAPIVGALVCAVAVNISLLLRTSMVPWLVVLGALGWAATWWRWRSGALALGPAEPGPRVLLTAAVVAILPPLLVDLPPTTQDARAIWWLHAGWFYAGGQLAHDAMTNPAYVYTHPAYPPLVPAVIAGVWHLHAAYDALLALRITQAFTAAAIASLAYFVARVLRVQGRVAIGVAVAVVLVAWGSQAVVGLTGLVDLTWAVMMVTGVVLLLAGDLDRPTIITGTLFVAAAALTKTEGQVTAVLVLPFVLIRARGAWRRAVPLAIAVFSALVAWSLVIRPDRSDRGDWGALWGALSPDSEVHQRLVATIPRVASDLGLLVLVCVGCVLAVVLLGRVAGTPVRQPGLLAMLLLPAAYTAFLVLTFAVRGEEIDFLLEYTAYRTVIFVRLLVLVDVVLAVVAGARVVGMLGGPPTPTVERRDDIGSEIVIGGATDHRSPDG